MGMTRGIIYVAVGDKYIAEATTSAHSVKRHCPSLHTTLFTDGRVSEPCFDSVMPADVPPELDHHNLCKVSSLLRSPYERTLYLDADTYVCADIRGMFQLLDWCDMAMTFTSKRKSSGYGDIPDWFTERNSGVLLYLNIPKVMKLFGEWIGYCVKYYEERGNVYDQQGLRAAMYHNKEVCVGALPPEFNCHLVTQLYVAGKVFIAHGHGDIEAMAREVNRSESMRLWLPGFGLIDRKAMTLLREAG